VLIVLGVAQVGLAIWHLESIVQATSKADSRLVLISMIGTGLYLGVLGSVITLVGGILASILADQTSSPCKPDPRTTEFNNPPQFVTMHHESSDWLPADEIARRVARRRLDPQAIVDGHLRNRSM